MLETINSPEQLKELSTDELKALCAEIREKIIITVSSNGGHLASNLGMVEAEVVLHRLFDFPKDTIIFDVGHQCYTHKLITGRYKDFSSLRKLGGISGFTNRAESEFDSTYAGHCGPSVSAALGFSRANKIAGSDAYTVAVVGDGAFTNGMIYEAINDCTDKDLRLIILLNDNEMSISKNVGMMARYFSELRTSRGYYAFKRKLKSILLQVPLVGKGLNSIATRIRDFIRRALVKDNIFELWGLDYLGAVDGNDIERLSIVLEEAKTRNRPCVVHMKTKKGLGYPFAEQNPDIYHSVGAFDTKVGIQPKVKKNFSSVFGDIMVDAAKYDESVCAVSAAMKDGTGLDEFARLYPERFFDVGIAEEHAVAFCGGLSLNKLKPVCAIYSTFIQRCFDQIFHDVALQDASVIFALDRSGFVEGDGVTHQGIFDVSLLSAIPKMSIYSPETYSEMEKCFEEAFTNKGLVSIRYPKGAEYDYDRSGFTACGNYAVLKAGNAKKKISLITYSRVTKNVYEAAMKLKDEYCVTLIKLIKIFPIEPGEVFEEIKDSAVICFIEEGIENGGIAQKTAAYIRENRLSDAEYICITLKDGITTHAGLEELYVASALDGESIYQRIVKVCKTAAK